MTEGQVTMIRLLEDGGQLDQFSGQLNRIEVAIDGIWNKVSFISIGDLTDNINTIEEYISNLERLDGGISTINAQTNKILDSVVATKGQDAADDLDTHYGGLIYDVQVKLNRLLNLLEAIVRPSNTPFAELVKTTKNYFPDPIDVT